MTVPFLKWAGGKRWLIRSNLLPIPATFDRYIEPFLGGGAVFFHLAPQKSILSDVNAELIELYRTIRDTPDEFTAAMCSHQALHCEEYYYKVRAVVPNDPVSRAARTLYLNRTCWNGLYRVNLDGNFNVPIGTKSTVIFEEEDFRCVSAQLKGADLRHSDFESVIDEAGPGDFLFVDPPYTVKHNFNGFIKYNEQIFGWDDQVRLRDAVAGAVRRGASVVVTNADHESVHELYDGLCGYRSVGRASVLASETARRGRTTEALFFANIG